MRTTLGLAAASLSLAFMVSCGGGTATPPEGTKPAPETGPIKIGEYGSLTGSTATFGDSTRKGIDLAIEEINAAGGVKGRQLQVLVEDDEGKPESAAAVVQKLIDQDKVVAVLGEVASSRSLAAAPICQRAGIPMITPSSTNPKVTEVGDYIFRVCFIDEFQGKVMAQVAKDELKATKAAILTDVKNDYSVGLAQYFKSAFTQGGGTVVAEESYSEGDKDFNGVLTKIKGSSPDVIVIPGYYTEVGLIAQQARSLGINQTLLGGDGWESPKLLEIGGSALEGSYYVNHYSAASPKPEVQGFVAKYKAKYGGDPDSIAALAYDACKLLADSMGRAASLKGSDIRDQIAAVKGFPGVCGAISFDANRNPVKPATVLKVSGGAVTFVSEVGAEPAPTAGAMPEGASAPVAAANP